jgi:hypothetical protein
MVIHYTFMLFARFWAGENFKRSRKSALAVTTALYFFRGAAFACARSCAKLCRAFGCSL